MIIAKHWPCKTQMKLYYIERVHAAMRVLMRPAVPATICIQFVHFNI